MSRILATEFEKLIERIKDGSATTGDVARANLLMELFGKHDEVLFHNCKPFVPPALKATIPKMFDEKRSSL